MKDILLTIDNKQVSIGEGKTILDAARLLGIDVPTLCHHKDLLPHGSCRLCLVELKYGSGSQLVASCGYYVKNGLVVETDSPRVRRARKLIVELLLSILPGSLEIGKLAKQYGVTATRYDRSLNYCVLCGLCVRYCAEIKKEDCIGYTGRGVEREVAWIPLNSYNDKCLNCMECMNLCPTGVFPSNWGLVDLC